ncbi:MAG: eukaryotic-like serine/threonine-protein kinase [Blastocatellia bacterium]|jgi:tetratricopeptide (TPR) repeat protein|nr:eukaryotic-like serine/threonine-protein kinase [Blastocatellia bacterium]
MPDDSPAEIEPREPTRSPRSTGSLNKSAANSNPQNESQETRRFDPGEIRLASPAPGLVLGERYRLDNELGRGAMGVVFRATDLQLMRLVAVKLLASRVSDDDMRARFLREARAAASLNHPHIISVYDVGEDHGFPFFVMELVEGPNLGDALPTNLPQVIEFALQICAALEHAHEKKIVHRDLKPANILLSGTTAKLADLGLALPERASRISQVGMIVGTAAYMAPEQALGKTLDGRADLYALGVMLYELTTGRVPFLGDPLATISQHLHAPVVPPRVLRPELPRALEAVILRLLAKDPAQRFATAAETAHALREAMIASDEESAEDSAPAVVLLDALARGRLIARDTELAEARELWRRAHEGRGHCLLVSGEPGAGKTRLAREVIVQATLDGAAVLSGACYEYEAATPYLPFVEAFRRWLREQTDDAKLREIVGSGASQIAKLAPEIETRLGPFSTPHQLPIHEERFRFFEAVTQMFARLAQPRGLLFYLDDLHWADSGTLLLLGHLMRNLREERVLIVASYRDTELDRAHPLAKALVDWNRERWTTRIVLKRFGPEETRAQITALLDENISGDFSAAVYRETEGNPFFVEEVMKALIEQGSVRRESGKWKRCELADLVIPQSVKEAIGNRLNRVSPGCNEVLRAAAVLGKTFTIEELTAAADGQNENALLDALDEAVAAQLLATDSEDAFAFTHDKIREVLYEELNPIRRRRLHRRTAEGLERHREKAPVSVEKLAHHYLHAGEYDRGLIYAKQAAAEAERIFAYDEAMAAYGHALECAESLGLKDEQMALEEATGNAALASGDTLRAIVHFDRALVTATATLDRARIQCKAATSLVITGDQRGLEYVREALTVLDPETHPMETANALSIEGRFHHLAGRHHEAIAMLERAAALATPAAEQQLTPFGVSTMATILAFIAGAYQHMGRYADGNVWAWRAVEFGKTHGALLAEALGYEFLGENGVGQGSWQESLEYATREREIAAKLHSRERLGWTYMVTSLSYIALGQREVGEQELREGVALAESLGEQRLTGLLKGNLAIVLADMGRTDEALQTAEENFASAERLGLLYTRAEARRCLAHVHFKSGELDETLRLCDEILELLGEGKSRVSRLWLGPLHIEALFAAGRADDARRQLTEYEAIVAECQSPRFNQEAVRLRELVGE